MWGVKLVMTMGDIQPSCRWLFYVRVLIDVQIRTDLDKVAYLRGVGEERNVRNVRQDLRRAFMIGQKLLLCSTVVVLPRNLNRYLQESSPMDGPYIRGGRLGKRVLAESRRS